MARKKLKRPLIAVFLCGAFALCALVLFFSIWPDDKSVETATPDAEYDFYAQMERAQVSAWFFQTHGVNLGSDRASWEHSYAGESPAKMLDQRVRNQSQYDQSLRTLALRYNAPPMPLFSEINTRLEAFNWQRQATVDAGGVVYGPIQYGLLEYYLTLRGNAESALVEAILDDALEHKEALLRERYAAMSTEVLTHRRTATLMLYVIDPEEFAARPAEAEQAQRTVLEALERDGEAPVEALTTLAALPVSIRELVLDSSELSKEDDFSAQLLAQAAELGVGGCFISPRSAGSDYTCIYQVREQGAGARPTFEEAKITVAALYANEAFEREIAAVE